MIYRFDEILLDRERRELKDGGNPISVEPKVFDVLLYLIEHRDRMVGRDELLDACWSGIHVSDGTLSRCISRVRQAIGQARDASEPIHTVHGRGYRFIGEVEEVATGVAQGEAPLPIASVADTPVGLQRQAMPAVATTMPERRQMTVLALRLTPDDPALQTDRERWHAAVTGLITGIAPVLKRLQGTLAARDQDRLTIHFGYPGGAEQATQAAVHAAWATIDEASMHGVAAAAGIASGQAILEQSGVEGGPLLMTGVDTLDANRLAESAGAGGCVADAASARFVGETAPSRPLDGAADFRIGRPHDRPFERETRISFFGRTVELFFLQQLWSQASFGRGQIVQLLGEPGIGKSRIVAELIDREQISPEVVLCARCSPYHQLSPYFPLLVMLRRRLGIDASTPPLRQLMAIEGLLEELGLPETDQLPLLASVLSIAMPFKKAPELNLEPARQRTRTLDALIGLVLAAARREPTVLWIDDTHWADPSTVAFIKQLYQSVADCPLLVVLAGREPMDTSWARAGSINALSLNPFTQMETRRFLSRLSEASDLSAGMIERIAARSDGVPLYLDALLALAPDSQRPDTAEVPEDLRGVLEARLDRLGEARIVAQWASVLGVEIDLDTLRAAVDLDAELVDRGLEMMLSEGLLRGGTIGVSRSLSFNHRLLRDAAYESMLESRRRNCHFRIAEVLVERFPEKALRLPEVVARHFEEAGAGQAAALFWNRAGQRSAENAAEDEARALFDRALKAARDDRSQGPDATETVRRVEALLAQF
ncbi:MAG: AAA family ATPase [Pseudomonadota bacterium]